MSTPYFAHSNSKFQIQHLGEFHLQIGKGIQDVCTHQLQLGRVYNLHNSNGFLFLLHHSTPELANTSQERHTGTPALR